MKEGGTKFFHALVYYGQKRESVLTLKPMIDKYGKEVLEEIEAEERSETEEVQEIKHDKD